jgi:hypothetical protein
VPYVPCPGCTVRVYAAPSRMSTEICPCCGSPQPAHPAAAGHGDAAPTRDVHHPTVGRDIPKRPLADFG